MEPTAFFFDMDHTLINNDCDVSWKKFLVACGLAPRNALSEADAFYEQYKRGALDVPAFLAFQLREFAGKSEEEMSHLCQDHFEAVVRPKIYHEGLTEVRQALASGRPTALLTATNNVIARPLAEFLGIKELAATNLDMKNGLYTGHIEGTYCVGEGKIIKAGEFCSLHGVKLAETCYYGDSISDIPMLSAVAFPVVCNPGPEVAAIAQRNHWPIKKFQ